MPYYELQGDILIGFCSTKRMRTHREEVESCWQALVQKIAQTPSSQMTDAQALLEVNRCCQLVQKWRRDCPFQTLTHQRIWCENYKPIIQRALQERKAREAQAPPQPAPPPDGGPPSVPCQPTPEGKLLCTSPIPGLSCFPAAQGMFVCEVPTIPPPGPAPPSIPGPVYPDWLPDFGPGGPPRFPASAFPQESFEAKPGEPVASQREPASALAKWLPWILLGGAAIGLYYLIRRMR